MKLIYHITLRISIALVVLMTVWATFFYFALIDEINDEVDDSLEDYSEVIITRTLAGVELPPDNDGSNNSYYIHKVDKKYYNTHKLIEYIDSMIYIPEKREEEPARILRTIFEGANDTYYALTVHTPTIEKEDLQEAIFKWILILYVGLLLTIICINIWVFYRALKPFYVLLNWLDHYVVGGQNRPLNNETNVTEFKTLNEATLSHIGRTEKAFEQQKQFIGNASHEMQTPLAICNNRLEWLLDNTELSEEQVQEILKTKQTLRYLVKLNKSLLFISKIDNGLFLENSYVNFNNLIKEQLSDYEEIYAYKEIKVKLIELANLSTYINDTLATSLVTNLLKNAFVHSKSGKTLTIEIRESGISVANQDELGALDGEHIFDRFFQGQKKEGSTGLGLVIVKSICNLYKIDLTYTYSDSTHYFVLANIQ